MRRRLWLRPGISSLGELNVDTSVVPIAEHFEGVISVG